MFEKFRSIVEPIFGTQLKLPTSKQFKLLLKRNWLRDCKLALLFAIERAELLSASGSIGVALHRVASFKLSAVEFGPTSSPPSTCVNQLDGLIVAAAAAALLTSAPTSTLWPVGSS